MCMRMATLLSIIVITACGTARPTPPPAPARPASPAAPVTPTPPTQPSYPGVPTTAAGAQLGWVLDAIVNRAGKVTRAEVEAHFHPTFLAQVPPDKTVEVFAQLAPQLAGLVLKEVKGTELRLAARIEVQEQKLQILVDLEPITKQMAGLLVRPEMEAGPKPTSLEDAVKLTEALAPKAQLLVASLDKGVCKPIVATKSRDALAIGSTFKLYVLLGLVDRILANKAKWDDELAVRDDWKSLPSGKTQLDPAGTKLTLREHAERMVSISDNTATDHLLYTVGRSQVEAAMRATKHATPKRNIPFLGTRELFLLKLGSTEDQLAKYVKSNEAQRRRLLDKELAGKLPELAQAEGWTTARRIDELEWFASTDDLCRAMATLWQRAQQAPAQPLLDVLSKNPGTTIDKTAWPYAGFKGGSEPGVINLTWLLRRADDKWFVVAITANAPAGKIDDAKVVGVATGVIELLGKAR